jgi:hypothetical protein
MIRADAQYVHGRSSHLLKLKPFDDDEFELVGVEEARGRLSGFAQRAILRLRDGRTFKAGLKCSRSAAKTLLDNDYRSATVRYFGLTPSGHASIANLSCVPFEDASNPIGLRVNKARLCVPLSAISLDAGLSACKVDNLNPFYFRGRIGQVNPISS